ncbi:GroES-like protein [Microthyrium microscopicum]|uniref:GroES-like protein n=1 Tax=Microthyrium microscopicum TaxID=703497 RepID=A0A6A6TW75_9PEZI|nr:GroES-like protein [Microthyrium microscopicum]
MSDFPTKTSQWVIDSCTGTSGLQLQHDIPLPSIGQHDVLVKIHAASLNARDIQILANKYMWGVTTPVVPLTDCAGQVLSIGSSVTRFKAGDRCASTFHSKWISGNMKSLAQVSQVGAHTDGVLRHYAVFNEEELVKIPSHLSYEEASTLPCAAVTAWNALFGGSTPCKPGDVVLTQGSGGVSLFANQFARAAGAKVIATTGELGGEREAVLEELGATTVLSYRDSDWGIKAKEATGGRGVDIVVEVSGAGEQSAKAIRLGAQIIVIGGSSGSGPSMFDMRSTMGEVRRITVGSRDMFEDMNRAIDVNGIKPVLDPKIWGFNEVKKAYEYAETGNHKGKVVIRIVEGST